MTRRGMCVTGGAAALSVATPAASASRLAYGPHIRQTLRLTRGRGQGPQPVVLVVGDAAEGPPRVQTLVQALNRRGIAVAVMDRRPPRHGFSTHYSDVARATGFLMAGREGLRLKGRLALLGLGTGVDAALMTAADRRYLAVVGLSPRDLSGMALLGVVDREEPTFTRPSAYGGHAVPAIFRGGAGDGADAIAFLSGLL